jgi:hypothetical protein
MSDTISTTSLNGRFKPHAKQLYSNLNVLQKTYRKDIEKTQFCPWQLLMKYYWAQPVSFICDTTIHSMLSVLVLKCDVRENITKYLKAAIKINSIQYAVHNIK